MAVRGLKMEHEGKQPRVKWITEQPECNRFRMDPNNAKASLL